MIWTVWTSNFRDRVTVSKLMLPLPITITKHASRKTSSWYIEKNSHQKSKELWDYHYTWYSQERDRVDWECCKNWSVLSTGTELWGTTVLEHSQPTTISSLNGRCYSSVIQCHILLQYLSCEWNEIKYIETLINCTFWKTKNVYRIRVNQNRGF